MSEALYRNTDPHTSIDAAIGINVAALEGVVLAALKRLGSIGATTEELSNILGMDRVTVSPRMRPLCNKKLIADSGTKRKGRSNKSSIVWVYIPEEDRNERG